MAGTPLPQVLTTVDRLRAKGVHVVVNPQAKTVQPAPSPNSKGRCERLPNMRSCLAPTNWLQGQVSVKPLRDGGGQASRSITDVESWAVTA